ncbi:FAD-binding domain protein [Ceratobasidium sp. AG-Ba]|nr:FAD-binding domain protein [Ceratobasidium sp. AG-Ba]
MADVLAASPELRTLILLGVDIITGHDNVSSFSPITLSKLEVLSVQSAHKNPFVTLFPIVAPTSSELSLKVSSKALGEDPEASISFFERSSITDLCVEASYSSPSVRCLAAIKSLQSLSIDFGLMEKEKTGSILDDLILAGSENWVNLRTLTLSSGTCSVQAIKAVLRKIPVETLTLRRIQDSSIKRLKRHLAPLVEKLIILSD